MKQKIILVYGDKGGCGTSTVSASIAKKLSKPKKTMLVSLSKYSQYTYDKCGLKAQNTQIDDLQIVFEDMDTKNKLFKKYEYIIFDISGSNKYIDDKIIQLYNRANMSIILVEPICSYSYTLTKVEAIVKSIEDISSKKIFPLFIHTKLNYNSSIEEDSRKRLDAFCREYKFGIFEHIIGYSKSIEMQNRTLDTKNCKLAITKLVEIIKEL